MRKAAEKAAKQQEALRTCLQYHVVERGGTLRLALPKSFGFKTLRELEKFVENMGLLSRRFRMKTGRCVQITKDGRERVLSEGQSIYGIEVNQ